jgi:hypothetical protein
VLLLCLIYGTETSHQSLWNILHHRFLDDDDVNLISVIAHFLLAVDIPDSTDGSMCNGRIRFCDKETLTQVTLTLKRYQAAAAWDRRRDAFVPKTIDRIEYSQHYHHYTRDSINFIPPSPRSSAPMYKEQAGYVRGITEYVWDNGMVDAIKEGVNTVNPLLRSVLNDTTRCDMLLGYPHNPLLKFHLASASFSVLGENKVLSSPTSDVQGDLVDTARKQFADWVLAARQNAHNTTFRFVSADCFAFAHTLQHNLTTGALCASWYRRQLDARALFLDKEAYGKLGDAPRQFDVIDTSHMPTINALRMADMTYAYLGLARPLLKDRASSTLYTTLVTDPAIKQDECTTAFRSLYATTSILLGLAPIEFWTNATSTSSYDDYYFGSFEKRMRRRIDWKLDKYLSAGAARPPEVLSCDADTLAAIFTRVYDGFFDEDLQRFDNSSFAEFARAVCQTIKTDVSDVCHYLAQKLSTDPRCASPAAVRGLVFSLRTVGGIPVETLEAPLTVRFGEGWEEMRDPVCLTLKLSPRMWQGFFHKHYKDSHLYMFTSLNVELSIYRRDNIDELRDLPHSGMHVTFGTVKHTPTLQNFLWVEEDPRGFSSNSTMILSFYVPPARDLMKGNAFIQLTMDDSQNRAILFHPDGKDHWVTPHRAGLFHLPVFGGGALPTSGLTSTATSSNGSFTRVLADDHGEIKGFRRRVKLVGDEEKQPFRRRARVKISQISPFTVTVTVPNRVVYPLHYPVPVAGMKILFLAHDLSYIEVDAPLAEPDGSDILDDYVFPTALGCVAPGGPVVPMTLNLPHLSLQNLPQIDMAAATRTKSTTRLIRKHARDCCSRSDISLRDLLQGHPIPRLGSFFIRLSFKMRVAEMYRATAAVGSSYKPMFFLANAGGTLQITIVPSGFFLDGGNGSIVLAAAVIPWTTAMQQDAKVRTFLQDQHHVIDVRLNDDEMRFWKTVLPALAERCREWSHGPACEYAAPGARIPLSLESKGPVLCSCGQGHLGGYVFDLLLPG